MQSLIMNPRKVSNSWRSNVAHTHVVPCSLHLEWKMGI